MKQTAVEWLENEFQQIFKEWGGLDTNWLKRFEQAKAMEKKQREKDFVEGYKTRALASNLIFDEKSEYYAKTLFNRTYKTK